MSTTYSRPSAEWFSQCYDQLCRLAQFRLARGWPNAGFQANSLVHEAWLRLGRGDSCTFATPAHFFSAAANVMRCILIDRARHRLAQRHGGGCEHLALESMDVPANQIDDQHLALKDALEKLATIEPFKAKLVRLRFLNGLSIEEAAKALGISTPTAKRHWTDARAWLRREIRNSNRG